MMMDRRTLLGGALAISLAGCSKQTEGTEEIHYGRETCTKCGMVISDPHFAAEIRGGADRTLSKFDDVGCASVWLSNQAWRDDAKTDFWVMDGDTGGAWLKAKEAWYMPGAMSPMNYGFLAVTERRESAVDFTAMQTSAVAKG